MEFNKNVFRAYDIRGIYGEDIDENFALHLGKALGTYFLEKGRKNMCCARDGRVSGLNLQIKFIEGVLSTGLGVSNLGMITSPMLYFAANQNEFDCGVNVTASHNPKEYNGFKIVDDKAKSVFGDEMDIVYAKMCNQDYIVADVPAVMREMDIKEAYLAKIHNLVDFEGDLKVVVDTANAVGGPFIMDVLDIKGLQVEGMYLDVDGNFPNHEANPQKQENMKDLAARVVETGADIGIGYDGDADRLGIIDEKGQFYSSDLILMLLARELLSRKSEETIIMDLMTSKVVENDIKRNGGHPIRMKVGHSHIEKAMHDEGALLGGEISGHMFFAEDYYGFDDAFLATLKVLEILMKSGKKFSELFNGLDEAYSTSELRMDCADDLKFPLIERVTKVFQDKGLKVLTIDGAFVELDEYTWGAVRASNTAPKITFRFESNTIEKLNEIIDVFYEVLSAEEGLDLNQLLGLKK